MTRPIWPLLLLLLSLEAARADIAPLPPPPAPPEGPQRATVRGLSVEQVYVRGRWRRWMTRIVACAPTRPACGQPGLDRCYVTAVGGTSVPEGDIAALQRAVGAVAGPVRIGLGGCAVRDLTLDP